MVNLIRILYIRILLRPTLPPQGVEFTQKMRVLSAVGDEAILKPGMFHSIYTHTLLFHSNPLMFLSNPLIFISNSLMFLSNPLIFPNQLKHNTHTLMLDPTMSLDQYLPKAHTCFFSINLPRYSTRYG
jgi:hypothetical protein